jgi:hypothetical protein
MFTFLQAHLIIEQTLLFRLVPQTRQPTARNGFHLDLLLNCSITTPHAYFGQQVIINPTDN